MTRYYGDRYIYDVKHQINSLSEAFDPQSYTIITGDQTLPENYDARRYADNAAGSAHTTMHSIDKELSDLDVTITAFYAHVNEVTEELSGMASNAYTVLRDAYRAMIKLEQLLLSSGKVSDLDKSKISAVFEPIKIKRNDYDSSLVKILVTQRSYLDKESSEAILYMLKTRGVTEATSEDLKIFGVVYDELIKKHDHDWIMDHLEMIFKSSMLDDIALTGRYSTSAQDACLASLTKLLENGDPAAFKMGCLVNYLYTNPSDPVAFYRLKTTLTKKEPGISDKQVQNYVELAYTLKEMGISDKTLNNSVDIIISQLSSKSLFDSDGKVSSGVIDSIVTTCIRKCFIDEGVMSGNSDYNTGFFDKFLNNTSVEERMEFLEFFQRLDSEENIPVQERLDFVLDFSMKFLGYEDYMDGNVHYSEGQALDDQYTYFGTLYGKNPWAWCGMFVCWMFDKAGLLDGQVIPGINSSNAIDSGLAGVAAYVNNCSPKGKYKTNDDYRPFLGDLVIFREYYEDKINRYHIAIVVGVDDDKVYTIEGNASAPLYNTDDHEAELAAAKKDKVGLDGDGHHQIRLKSYPFDYERIGGYCKMGGTEQSTRLIDDKRDMIADGYDFRDILLSCSDGFKPNLE